MAIFGGDSETVRYAGLFLTATLICCVEPQGGGLNPAEPLEALDAQMPTTDASAEDAADASVRDTRPRPDAMTPRDAEVFDAGPDAGHWTDPPYIPCLSEVPRACGGRMQLEHSASLPENPLRDFARYAGHFYLVGSQVWRTVATSTVQGAYAVDDLDGFGGPDITSLHGEAGSAMFTRDNLVVQVRDNMPLRTFGVSNRTPQALPFGVIGAELSVASIHDGRLVWQDFGILRSVPSHISQGDRVVAYSESDGVMFAGSAYGAIGLREVSGQRHRLEPDTLGAEPEFVNIGPHHFVMDEGGHFFEFCEGRFQPRASPGATGLGTELFDHLYVPHPAGPHIFAATESGVSQSCDGGRTWTPPVGDSARGLAPSNSGIATITSSRLERWRWQP